MSLEDDDSFSIEQDVTTSLREAVATRIAGEFPDGRTERDIALETANSILGEVEKMLRKSRENIGTQSSSLNNIFYVDSMLHEMQRAGISRELIVSAMKKGIESVISLLVDGKTQRDELIESLSPNFLSKPSLDSNYSGQEIASSVSTRIERVYFVTVNNPKEKPHKRLGILVNPKPLISVPKGNYIPG